MGNCSTSPSDGDSFDSFFPNPPNVLSVGKLRPISGTFRILLLGTGESGKSTVIKQLKILYGQGFTTEETENAKELILTSCIRQMQILLTIASENKIIILPKNKATAEKIINFDCDVPNPWKTELGEYIKQLWNDPGIKEAFNIKSGYQFIDNLPYFFDSIERLSSPSWSPSVDDLLRIRQKTKDPYEEQITYQGKNFVFVDAGGQRGERKKWKNLFDKHYSLILYISSISDFDEVLREDSSQNRMEESLQLWDLICSSNFFRTTPLVTFFTKEDLLVGKEKSLTNFWPGYKGGDDVEKAKIFIKNRFIEKDYSPHIVYSTFVNTIDSKNFREAFEDIIHKLTT